MSNKKDNNININEMINRVNRGGKNLQGTEAADILDSFEDELVKPHKKMSTFKKILLIVLLAGVLVAIPTAIIINANVKRYVNTYIDFNIEQAEDFETKHELGTKISKLEAKEVEGYRFDGWYKDKEYTTKFANDTKLRRDTTVYGKYIRIHNVTLYFRGVPTTKEIDEGIKLEDAINEFEIDSNRYRCDGLFKDSNYTTEISKQTIVDKDYTIYGKYIKLINITVHYDGDIKELRYDEGSSLKTILLQFVTERNGYTFQGWSDNEEYNATIATNIAIDRDITVYGRFAKILNITAKVIGGSQAEIRSNEYDILEEIESKLGINYHNSCGWFKDEGLTTVVEEFDTGTTIYTKQATLDKVRFGMINDLTYRAYNLDENVTGEVVVPKMYNNRLVSDIYFRYSLITKITLPSGLTTMWYSSLANCDNLETLVIPNSVTNVMESAIANSQKLREVVLSNKANIERNTFNGCTGLESINIPEGVESIGNYAFYGCANLKSVTIAGSVKNIEPYAFCRCENLTTVTLEEGIEIIGKDAFSHNPKLANITIPEGVKEIGQSAFIECVSLTNITIPNGVKKMGQTAFYQCIGLESVNIAEGAESIGRSAFNLCTNLKNVTIAGSVKNIEPYAFYKCENLTTLILGEGVESIGEHAFADCINLSEVILPNSMKTLEYATFVRCSNLTNVTMGNNLESIGVSCFNACINLATINLSTNLKSIERLAFYQCKKLQSVSIPGGVKSIENNAFYQCESLTSLTLGEGIEVINSGAFADCTNLSEVILPDSMKILGDSTFVRCSNLTNVTMGNNLETIGVSCFNGCINLETINLSTNLKSIERLAFYQCKKLQSVSIPGGVKNISEYAFSHCESLTSLTLGEGIETIDREAFACCYNLASIIIPSSMRYIVKYAFWSCNNVNYAKFEDTTTWLITGDVNYSNLQLVDVENEDMKQIIYNLIKKVYYWYKIG